MTTPHDRVVQTLTRYLQSCDVPVEPALRRTGEWQYGVRADGSGYWIAQAAGHESAGGRR